MSRVHKAFAASKKRWQTCARRGWDAVEQSMRTGSDVPENPYKPRTAAYNAYRAGEQLAINLEDRP